MEAKEYGNVPCQNVKNEFKKKTYSEMQNESSEKGRKHITLTEGGGSAHE